MRCSSLTSSRLSYGPLSDDVSTRAGLLCEEFGSSRQAIGRRLQVFATGFAVGPSEDSNRLSPGGLDSSPWLYIQSGALQGVAAHLGPVESVHLKKIRGMRQ
jgi:hypothetical protein